MSWWMKHDTNTLKWTHFPINHSSMNSTVTVNTFGLFNTLIEC